MIKTWHIGYILAWYTGWIWLLFWDPFGRVILPASSSWDDDPVERSTGLTVRWDAIILDNNIHTIYIYTICCKNRLHDGYIITVFEPCSMSFEMFHGFTVLLMSSIASEDGSCEACQDFAVEELNLWFQADFWGCCFWTAIFVEYQSLPMSLEHYFYGSACYLFILFIQVGKWAVSQTKTVESWWESLGCTTLSTLGIVIGKGIQIIFLGLSQRRLTLLK